MATPEMDTESAMGHLMARGWSHKLARDAAVMYETDFASLLEQGRAFSREHTSNTYKLAATAFVIAYIEYNKSVQYDILHTTSRSPFAPPPDSYEDREVGFQIGQGDGLAQMRFVFNEKGTRGHDTPETLTRALVKTLKKIQPNMFRSLAYSEPTHEGDGFAGRPLRPLSIFHMPLNDRLTLQILAAPAEDASWDEPIRISSHALCQFGLVVADPDGSVARAVESPRKQALLTKKLRPRALWDACSKKHAPSEPAGWVHLDLPPDITADDVDAVMEALYGENPSETDSAYLSRFASIVYSVVPIRKDRDLPPILRLILHVTESRLGTSIRKARAMRQIMKRRSDLTAVWTKDAPLPPPKPL